VTPTDRTRSESFLITQAGVTAIFWRSPLGAPSSAEEAAVNPINSLIGVDDGALLRAGTLLHGRPHARSAGRVWAATGGQARAHRPGPWPDHRHRSRLPEPATPTVATWEIRTRRAQAVPGFGGPGI
jgi:hypothetical protein